MLRNELLTSYGFSELGRTARQVENVAWWVAAVLVMLALAGFVHAKWTLGNKVFTLPEVSDGMGSKKEMVSV